MYVYIREYTKMQHANTDCVLNSSGCTLAAALTVPILSGTVQVSSNTSQHFNMRTDVNIHTFRNYVQLINTHAHHQDYELYLFVFWFDVSVYCD